MSTVLLDDHLLADVLAGTIARSLRRLLPRNEAATTNLGRLCRAAASARGGAITGQWDPARREEAAQALLQLPDDIQILPMRDLAWRMALLGLDFRLSTLGAETVAAAEQLGARVVVWSGDVGPGIRQACVTLRIRHDSVERP